MHASDDFIFLYGFKAYILEIRLLDLVDYQFLTLSCDRQHVRLNGHVNPYLFKLLA